MDRTRWRYGLVLLIVLTIVLGGCQNRLYKKRDYYRQQADEEVNVISAQAQSDPRWEFPQVDVYMDMRSRYFDPEIPDRPPMPQDDPYSNMYMHEVSGMKGWKHWYDNGVRMELENPGWYEQLGGYVNITPEGKVVLSLDSSVDLAYIHSTSYQSQLETLYLSALDVSAERFRLQTQFFGGLDTVYTHSGELRSGVEQNVLSVGRGSNATFLSSGVQGSGGSRLLDLNRRFPTAGTLLVGFANSFVWQFTDADTNLTSSIINFNLVQPLLRQAGRDVALEQLTIVERSMLANLRAMQRYRQGFYTSIAIGSLGVSGPQRRGGFFGGTGLTGFTGTGTSGLGGVGDTTGFGRSGFGVGGATGGTSGTGFAGGGAGTVGGFIGLLQQLQQIRNTQDSLNRQLRTLSLLEAHLQAGVIDLTQVDQFRQNIETERANLLQAQNDLQNSIETYLMGTLGLPPHVPVELDDSMIRQFQFVDPLLTIVQNRIADLQDELGQIPAPTQMEPLGKVLDDAKKLPDAVTERLQSVQQDLDHLADNAPLREKAMSPEEKSLFKVEQERLRTAYTDLRNRLDTMVKKLDAMHTGLKADTVDPTFRETVIWLTELVKLTQELTLVQASARLEAVVVESVELTSEEAFYIAQANRLDLMNNRAALVDTWRLIAFNADGLQGGMNVVFSGDVRTKHDNMLDFRGKTGTLQAGIQFDAPLTRLLERNNYRQSLISYQQDRRQFIQFLDSIHETMRQTMRRLQQLQTNLEIQRRAMAISIRRVDLTQEELNKPVPPAAPGQAAAEFGPTAALNLLTALSDLRNTQNNFMSVWLNYHATRMSLLRELGIMVIDEDGNWIDLPLEQIDRMEGEMLPLPPAVPVEWMRDAFQRPEDRSGESLRAPEVHQRPSANDPPPVVTVSES